MDCRRVLLTELLLVLVGQVDEEVDEITELVQVAEAVFSNADLSEQQVLRPSDHVLNLAVVVLASNASELRDGDHILPVQVWRIEQHVLERDHHPEVQPHPVPFLDPALRMKVHRQEYEREIRLEQRSRYKKRAVTGARWSIIIAPIDLQIELRFSDAIGRVLENVLNILRFTHKQIKLK